VHPELSLDALMGQRRRISDPAAIEREILRLSTLDLEALRALWRPAFKRDGKGLTRDLLLRTLAWKIQEGALGGYDSKTAKALNHYTKSGDGTAIPDRHLRSGTVLVREYQGKRQTVTVVPEGFVWQERTYSNLSKIAKAITGVKWNGPRFFGLRQTKHLKLTDAGAGA
jgi:hypothetical protein